MAGWRLSKDPFFKEMAMEIVWDGKGNPPIGSHVEYRCGCEWRVAEVLAHKHGKVVGWDDELGTSGLLEVDAIRPLASQEQREIEQLLFDVPTLHVATAKKIHAKGYRKKR